MLKIVILYENFGPYHFSRVEACSLYSDYYDWQISGVELSRSQQTYSWRSNPKRYSIDLHTVIQNKPLEETSKLYLITKLIKLLNTLNPDVISIAGYSNPVMLSALIWGILYKKRLILMSATKEDDTTRNPLTENIKHWLLNLFNSALVGGKPQKRYLIKLGKLADSIFTGYNVVGNDTFHPDKLSLLSSPLENPFFLTINRFVPKKNLFFLLDAFSDYLKSTNVTFDLVLSGDGFLKSSIIEKIKELKIQDNVHLTGFLQQEELLPYFAHAACFIHASIQEQWGLVVNEAMAAGLPVIVSERCGCFEDLVVEGVNGFGFNPENRQQLTDLMLKMSSNTADLQAMGQASLQHIQQYSPDHFAQGLKRAVDYALCH